MPTDKLSEKVLGDPFECAGMWWLPNRTKQSSSDDTKTDERLYGTLKFAPGQGITLHIIGFFSKAPLEAQLAISFETDIILGLSLEGEKITLLNCVQTGAKLQSAGINTCTFQVQSLIAGEHVISRDDLAFDAFSIQCTYLDDWIRKSGFKISPFDRKTGKKEFSVRYEQPEETEVVVGKYKISIQTGLSFTGAGIFTKKIVAQQSTRFHIASANSDRITHADGMALASSIQRFLSLMTIEPVALQVVEGLKIETSTRTIARLLYEPIPVHSPSKQLHPNDILFPLDQIHADLAVLLDNFINDQNLKPVYVHFFADFYNPPTYDEERFLSAVSAIEAFHRRVFEQSELSNKNYYFSEVYPRFKALLNEMQLDTELAAFLHSNLEGGYESSLQARLKSLLKDLGEPFVQVFIGADNVDQFIDSVVQTKDYLTTLNKAREKKAAQGIDLSYLRSKLELLFFTIVLVRIGMNKEVVREALATQSESQFRRFGYLKSRLQPQS